MNLERIIEEFHQGHSLNAYEVFHSVCASCGKRMGRWIIYKLG